MRAREGGGRRTERQGLAKDKRSKKGPPISDVANHEEPSPKLPRKHSRGCNPRERALGCN